MITLYTFGAAFGLPDVSPFVIKAHVLLKMAGQPYQTNHKGFNRAPKGKLPYIDDGGTIVADSTFIRWHLERQYGVDFDQGLDPAQRGVAWAAEKLVEDHLYWMGLRSRWLHEKNFRTLVEVFFKPVPAPLRGLVASLVRRKLRQALMAQGMGRHSDDEVLRLARSALAALSAILGDKPYLMGDQPCAADATLYGALTSALCPAFESPMKAVLAELPNLLAYEARMKARYFPQG
jgi:glutathione S-transferase